MLEEARRLGASDVHVISGRPPLFRIAGEMVPQGEVLPHDAVERMLLPHVPARLKGVLEKDGSCDFAVDFEDAGRFRVNVGRQRTGLKGTFRVIGREVPTLESLGLPPDIAKATHHHQGLIVVTGPSGHGKTSTLAAIVDIINRETTHHILTVEDPVEYVHPRKKGLISQREVGTHTRTFASALKGSLREDPDVIVVGELRDTETVRMALSASETGHLLIATMNTPSAAKTIDRLIDLFPPADQGQVRMSLAAGLRLVVSQRLVPTPDGKGVVAAAELLPGSVSLGNLIRDNKTFQIPSLQQRGKGMGIIRFDDSLAELVKAGRTTLELARGFAENPDELEAMVTGKRPGAPPPEPEVGNKLMGKMGSLLGKKSA
jgi:twitching motility protein PilT